MLGELRRLRARLERELARREATFALHVHVGVDGPAEAIRLLNRMRAHLPLLLALSVNSPFWQGRDSGLGSTRTPLALPEPTFLWWDVRPQPKLGTVEVRVADAQRARPGAPRAGGPLDRAGLDCPP